ncbi:MAG TPA: nitroreductase family protein [Elusimicrobiota bacterium]|jgi:nitroreductase|nr:nitroreductase family protein [Elusimicrobiota bacterium]
MKRTTAVDLTHDLSPEVHAARRAEHDILPLFLNRWSPRSMTGEALPAAELLPLFEAARWAPSSYNAQLWRFIVARRQNRHHWEKFLSLLVPGNAEWAKQAAALVLVVARKNFERNGRPSITHAFDAGAAWENLALECARRGLVAHGMEGFDYERARVELGVPDDFEALAMLAIGKRAPRGLLPEKIRAMEAPNGRRPLREILFEGKFGVPAL